MKKTLGLPGLVGRCVAPEGIRLVQRVNKGKANTCLGWIPLGTHSECAEGLVGHALGFNS